MRPIRIIAALLCPAALLAAASVLPETVVSADRLREEGDPAATRLVLEDEAERGLFDAGQIVRAEPLVSLRLRLAEATPSSLRKTPVTPPTRFGAWGGNRVQLLIDGVRQPEAFSSGGGARRDYFDPAVFQSLDIFKGAGTFAADSLGGAAAFSTGSAGRFLRPGETRRLRLSTLFDGANTSWREVATGAVRQGPVEAFASVSAQRGHETLNHGEKPPNPQDFGSHHALAKLRWKLGETHTLGLTAEDFARAQDIALDSTETYQPLLGFGIGEAAYEARPKRQRLGLSHELTGAEGTFGISSLDVQRVSSDTSTRQAGAYRNGRPARDRTDSIFYDQTLLAARTRWEVAVDEGEPLSHRLRLGAELSLADAENRYRRLDLFPVRVEEDLIGMAPTRTTRAGLSFEDEIKTGLWTIAPGLRLDHTGHRPDNDPAYLSRLNSRLPPGLPALRAEPTDVLTASPSLRVARAVGDGGEVWARYAQGHRQPTAEELTGLFFHGSDFIILPNSGLVGEKSQGFELGASHRHQGVEWSGSVFHNSYSDFLENVDLGRLDPADPTSLNARQLRNVGSVRIVGWETRVSVPLTLLSDDLTGFSAIFTAGQAFGENLSTGESLRDIEPFKASATLAWASDDDRLGFGLSAYFQARRHDVPASLPFVPDSSLVLDLSGRWQATDHLRLNAGLRNLTDARYHLWSAANGGVHFADDPDRTTQPGLHAYIGLTLDF